MSNAGILSALAIVRRAPLCGSVTKTRWRCASAPTEFCNRPRMTRYCAIVSAVPPDLEMTIKRARFKSSRSSSAAMVRGSTLSSTCRRGHALRSSLDRAFHCGLSNAVLRAIGPNADPPIPRTTTSSNCPRVRVANSVDWRWSAVLAGSSRKPSSLASRRRAKPPTARANPADASRQSLEEMPPATTSAMKLV